MGLDNVNDFKEKFTQNARESLASAEELARSVGANYIGTEHILIGVLSQTSSIASKILRASGVDVDSSKVALNIGSSNLHGLSSQRKKLSENAKLALKMSIDIAGEFQQSACGTEHILYSIVTQKNGRAAILLKDLSADVDKITESLEQYLNRQQHDVLNRPEHSQKLREFKGVLDVFGTDITMQAKQKKLDPLVGRKAELERIVTILGRRHKNNPLLIGEPGVGKTALVEGLAQRIVSDTVPANLSDKRIIMLDLSAVIAGTKYRGEFEDRLQKIIEQVKNDDSIILFIDEIHLLVGAGAAEGAIDAGNMLKPLLARGSIRVIGATTIDEFTNSIEKDSALERRFQVVKVKQPTQSESITILQGLKSAYEQHHQVEISDEVIKEAVRLSSRYINDRFLPDKAIDLIDDAAAWLRSKNTKPTQKLKKITSELKRSESLMEVALDNQDYERAAYLKTRIAQLQKQSKQAKGRSQTLKLSDHDLAVAVSQNTGIPVQKVEGSEANSLLKLDKIIAKNVVSQDVAVQKVVNAIKRGRTGVKDETRPIGSFIFLGPTGVGKSELAKVLAHEVFGRDDALIKIDMSELSDRHTVSKLLGAPAGFVGYEDNNQLTDRVRRNPYSLILFDEMEKAHPEVFNILLQILEDGQLTDSKGRNVDFSNTIIIMTSNIGADILQKEVHLGFSAASSSDEEGVEALHTKNASLIKERLRKSLRPELLARFDDVIVFRSLDKKAMRSILNLQIEKLSTRLNHQGLGLTVSAKAKNLFLKNGFDEKSGARNLRKLIETEIGDRVADMLLKNEISKGDVLEVDIINKKLNVQIADEKTS